jgi:hypothetical protein
MKFLWILPALTLALCVTTLHADDQADLKALLARAITAHGGAENLNKYQAASSRGTGKVHIMGMDIDYSDTTHVQAPDKLRQELMIEVMGQKINILQIFNGKDGWLQVNGKDMDLTKEQKEQAQESLANNRFMRLTPLIDKAYTLSPLGEIMVDGQPAVGIRAQCKGSPDANLYFDKKTAMLVKSEMQMNDPANQGQKVNGETFYSDYRKIEGLMVPFKIVIKIDGKAFVEVENKEFTPAEKLDDNLFTKP